MVGIIRLRKEKFGAHTPEQRGKIGMYCGLVVVGYSQGNIQWQRAKQTSGVSPSGKPNLKEAVQKHNGPFYYDNFLFDFTRRAEVARFILRAKDQDKFDFENIPRNEMTMISLKPSKTALEDLHFRLGAITLGYNKLRSFIRDQHNIPEQAMPELRMQEMFTPDGKITANF